MRYQTRLASRQSKKFIERKKSRGLIIGLLIIVSVISCIYAVSQLTYLNFLTIENFDVVGADQGMSRNIQSIARDSLRGQILGMFSRANSFIYSKSSLTAAILNLSPKIGSVSISRKDLQTLSIIVKEKQAVATICPGLPDFDANSLLPDSQAGCFDTDQEGYIFEPASTASTNRNLYYVQALADASSSPVGSQAFLPAEFSGLQYFYDGARQAGLSIQAILAKDSGEYEMYVSNGLAATSTADSGTTVVYFNNLRSFSDQLANLISFWNNSKGSFEYIDVRYGSNVFYRLMQ